MSLFTIIAFLWLSIGVLADDINMTFVNEETFTKEQLQNCTHSSFDASTVEKAGSLIMERYKPHFVPYDFIRYIKLIEHDIYHGFDTSTEQKIQAYPIIIFSREIIQFSKCMKGSEYSHEVTRIFGKMLTL